MRQNPLLTGIGSDRGFARCTTCPSFRQQDEFLAPSGLVPEFSPGCRHRREDSVQPACRQQIHQIRIRRFDAEYSSGSEGRGARAPEVHVILDCTFGRRSGREVIATFVAEGSAVATTNRLSDVVAAFEDATNLALSSLATRSADAAYAAGQKVDNPVTSITR